MIAYSFFTSSPSCLAHARRRNSI